jgi:flagellar assembly protein FliH
MHQARVPLARWPFPALDIAPPPAPLSAEPAIDPAGDLEAELAATSRDQRGTAQLMEEQIENGHAEGLQRGLAEGRKQGYADGFAAGMQAAQQALAAQAHHLVQIIARLGAPITALDRTVEDAVVALALEVARRVIGSEISTSREYLVRLIHAALAQVPVEVGQLRIALNPADLELVRSLAPEIEHSRAVLVSDEAIEAGGCVVVGDGQGPPIRDMRWRQRAGEGMSQVDLTLASRWRSVMLTLFEGEDQ